MKSVVFITANTITNGEWFIRNNFQPEIASNLTNYIKKNILFIKQHIESNVTFESRETENVFL